MMKTIIVVSVIAAVLLLSITSAQEAKSGSKPAQNGNNETENGGGGPHRGNNETGSGGGGQRHGNSSSSNGRESSTDRICANPRSERVKKVCDIIKKRREEMAEGGMSSGEDDNHNEGMSTAHTAKPHDSTQGMTKAHTEVTKAPTKESTGAKVH